MKILQLSCLASFAALVLLTASLGNCLNDEEEDSREPTNDDGPTFIDDDDYGFSYARNEDNYNEDDQGDDENENKVEPDDEDDNEDDNEGDNEDGDEIYNNNNDDDDDFENGPDDEGEAEKDHIREEESNNPDAKNEEDPEANEENPEENEKNPEANEENPDENEENSEGNEENPEANEENPEENEENPEANEENSEENPEGKEKNPEGNEDGVLNENTVHSFSTQRDLHGEHDRSSNSPWRRYFGRQRIPVCKTKKCVIAAADILRNMNSSANPCDDFYEYACGGFGDYHQIRGFQGKLHSFALLRQRLAYDLRNILTKIDVSHSLKAIRYLKLFYDDCMNTKLINKNGITPQVELLKKYFTWPIKDSSWPGKNWNVKESLRSLFINLGVSPLFSAGIGLDDKNAKEYTLKFSSVGLSLPRSYYDATSGQKKKTLDAYTMLIKKLYIEFGAEGNTDDIAKEIVEFEREISRIKLSPVAARDIGKVYKKMSLDAFNKVIPEVGLIDIVKDLYKLAPGKKTISGSDTVVVLNVDYFSKLSSLLKKTNPSVIAKYFVWNVIAFLGHFAPTSMENVYQEFRKVYMGTSVSVPRWKSCLGTASSGVFGMVTGRLYVQLKFNKRNKLTTSRMVKQVKREFLRNLKKLKWMDPKTKARAARKAKSVVDLVAYPKWILNDRRMKKEYRGLKLQKNDYMGNYFRLQDFSRKKELVLLVHKKRNRKRWTSSPAIVNAFYSQTYNRIVFPAGILQPPFVDSSLPTALNFGGIGTVIGHELTHGFDDKGRKYDEDGNYVSWWSEKSAKAFTKKANCIRSQYSNYKEYGAHINGALTAGENIADNGGVKMAYYAMQKQLRSRRHRSFKLPGLEKYTNAQLFFLGFSRLWCTINRKAFTLQRIATDHHTLSKYRVIGVLSNMKEFSRAFRCPIGSPMNPENKCIVW